MNKLSNLTRLIGLLLFAAATILSGCSRAKQAAVSPPPPDVMVTVPVKREVTDFEDFTGRTEPYKLVEIRSRVSGELMKYTFADGAFVDSGAPLFEIDKRVYKAQRDSAKATLDQAKAQLVKAEVLVRNATKGRATNVIPEEEYDTKVADQEAAKAAVAVAEAALVLAQQNLDWTDITAPFAGRLSKRMVDPGNLVTATGGTASGTLLTTLVALDPIYIGFDIDEMTLERRREGIRAGKIPTAREGKLHIQVGTAHQDGLPFDAVITFSDNQLDAGTGTLHIRAEMSNPTLKLGSLPALVGWAAASDVERNGLRMLSPGMFVRVRLPMGQPHSALMVPEEAIGSDQGEKFVYVVVKVEKDSKVEYRAEYRKVILGPQDGKLRAIEKGISAGEQVIVSGHQRVRKGQPVNPKPSESSPPASAALPR